jgi:hypothetical protein
MANINAWLFIKEAPPVGHCPIIFKLQAGFNIISFPVIIREKALKLGGINFFYKLTEIYFPGLFQHGVQGFGGAVDTIGNIFFHGASLLI